MRYEYIRFRSGLGGNYKYRNENGKMSPRQVINDMAAKGYRFAGYVPVSKGSYGSLYEYDMIFEKPEDKK